MSCPLDLSAVDAAIARVGSSSEKVIPILQALQSHYGYLPQEALEYVCARTEITPASIAGVSTFYSQFRHRPVGKHVISVCHGTACHVKGSGLIQDAFEQHLKMNGSDTDPDGLFTIEKVACLGCCTLAPVILIDGVTYGHLTPAMIPDVVDDFLTRADMPESERPTVVTPDGPVGEIRIGMGSCCRAQGSADVLEAVNAVLGETGAPAKVKHVGCVGMCHQTPLVEIVPPTSDNREPPKSDLFAKVKPHDVRDIVLDRFRPKSPWQRLGHTLNRWLDRVYTDEVGNAAVERVISPRETPVCEFLGPQKHIATEHCGRIDPTDYEEYIRSGGFEAARKVANEMAPDAVIEDILAAGVRGRGGAGFPTGRKWSFVRAAKGDKKYIVCNGDEGDPGAFMDRMLLESFPYRIIEGMIIGAIAVGADEGYLYIRAEYPLAVERIRDALDRCYQEGILGDSVLGSGHSLHLHIKEGAGAFVCGEETALLESIEGRRGMPRLRPPYPAEAGLYGKPTLVNNVETYSLVPWILRNGSDKFASLGTGDSKGTKVFALAGKIRNGGLIEVPMGVTIRQIVDEIGGGVANDRQFKAVQIGGPSGGCVPADLADTTIDFEALSKVGAIMGSGGLVVLDENDCMVDIARYFLEFTQEQSCGKCTFCRVGTRRMLDILERLCRGEGKKGDLEELERLAVTVRDGSLCGLGGTAPNPVLSTLRYFRDEYEAHLEGRCPAGKCSALITYTVTDECIGCTLCAQACPVNAIASKPYQRHSVDMDLCTRCDTCRDVCPRGAIVVE